MKGRTALTAVLTTILLIITGSPAGAIVGGELVTYPWAVAFVRNGATPPYAPDVYCSGVLIKADWVLTAAHCNVAQADHVFVGRGNPDNAGGSVRLASYAWKMWQHPSRPPGCQTTQDLGPCDLAVVRLNNPVPNNDLDLANSQVNGQWGVGTTGRMYGFGQRSLSEPSLKGVLFRADAIITEHTADNFRLLARGGTGQASCYGDSGGPLVVSTSMGPRVVGIITRTAFTEMPPFCEGRELGDYVRVAYRGSAAASPAFRWITTVV
jgi:hypothetical protein